MCHVFGGLTSDLHVTRPSRPSASLIVPDFSLIPCQLAGSVGQTGDTTRHNMGSKKIDMLNFMLARHTTNFVLGSALKRLPGSPKRPIKPKWKEKAMVLASARHG